MRITLIAAVADNQVIGHQNQLPWRLPADLQQFKRQTWHQPVVMGRHTYVSLGRPLPGRHLIVVSRQAWPPTPGVEVISDVERAMARAAALAEGEVLIAGGAQLYAYTLPRATRLWLTRVHAHPPGDAYFPPWTPAQWRCVASVHQPADDRHAVPFSFERWLRR